MFFLDFEMRENPLYFELSSICLISAIVTLFVVIVIASAGILTVRPDHFSVTASCTPCFVS